MNDFDLSLIIPPNKVAVALRTREDAIALVTAIKEQYPNYVDPLGWGDDRIRTFWDAWKSNSCVSLSYQNRRYLVRGPIKDFIIDGCMILEIEDILSSNIEESGLDYSFLYS